MELELTARLKGGKTETMKIPIDPQLPTAAYRQIVGKALIEVSQMGMLIPMGENGFRLIPSHMIEELYAEVPAITIFGPNDMPTPKGGLSLV